jgi:hypothetical protein
VLAGVLQDADALSILLLGDLAPGIALAQHSFT